ncbi:MULTISPECIES: DOMON-like domain-containing protein [unclassified Nodularia (in: cyanobacteria)]|uniref:DOMON-like domain-containing protein n=1 Tax=unclassified Nodularia (in: cyanobacteria) TaxID=2656917 RepID=UPI00187FE94B|nr:MULTISPECIES: DOMON-like domain-containing protein [unclassified Nodularia (in: cyanobacteria)]MBE9197795.1 DOMON-like domain-containing protein [Nodularia sp. LEGE 06071]MCC2695056.1 DOMON-like domain-containing protein [Nodularia sp. LEGE 04288]
MTNQTFSLKPFPSEESLPNLQITGSIARFADKLSLSYHLSGDLTQVVIPPISDTPVRSHQLWENTCFEFFIGIKDSAQYWEFNLSPAGHWNVYHFDGYRQGMQEETAFNILPFTVQKESDSLTLVLDVDLGKIAAIEAEVEVAITTVIKDKASNVTYWALVHSGVEADFHLRDSFIIEL